MAEKKIIQNMIAHLGQSQRERRAGELDPRFAGPDERTTADLLRFARDFAPFVRYHPPDGSAPLDWTAFFDYDDAAIERLVAENGGEVPPHLALFLAFLELYKKPQELLNDVTGRHLDFYYRDVLRITEKAPVPDRAHLLLELKKGATPVLLGPGNIFSAGKDATGVEMIYAPVRDTVLNTGRVDSLRSIFLDRTGHGTLRYAPVANSADGLGGKFQGEPQWPAFGGRHLPAGEVGFAVAAPVLRMKEGRRTVRIRLALSGAGVARLSRNALAEAFEVFITAEKKWLGPIAVAPTLGGGGMLELQFVIDEKEPAVIDYDRATHGYAYAAGAPVVQVLIREESMASGYLDFEHITLESAEIFVDVTGVTSLSLESDAGSLDPKKAFLPFGPQPTVGSRFIVGYSEALSKDLSRLGLKITWKDIPNASFTTHYAGYGVQGMSNGYFTAAVKFKDGEGEEYSGIQGLFNASDARAEHEIVLTLGGRRIANPVVTAVPFDRKIQALVVAGRSRTLIEADRHILRMPVFSPARTSFPAGREGVVTFFLNTDFLHTLHRRKFIENVVAAGSSGRLAALNDPYTPSVQSISLSYSAHSGRTSIASATLDDFAGGEIQFYHITPTGARREHGYLRHGLGFITERGVSLLPPYRYDGELLIGLADLSPGDSVNLLFQIAEGSADPDILPPPVEWSVLCDNHWKRLGTAELVLDTTGGLLLSGIVGIIVPSDATADNTVLPSGRIWIKAGVRGDVRGVSRLIEVAANAVETRFIDGGNDPDHLERPLEAGTITRLKNGMVQVKSARQPYASFGGRPAETSGAFHTRVSERLRHKNRCVTAWDYERMVLEAFPRVHRVKCIPHAKEGSWGAPGHVMLIVVPDLRNMNALDPLQPRVDAGTLAKITEYVREHAGLGVIARVRNPRYQKIRLDFKVRFHTGYEFNYYRNALEKELIRALSPWAFDAKREIAFGGSIYKSVLLDIVEELDYVDYITDFRMYSYSGATNDLIDRSEARAETPDMVLVSDSSHTILEIPL